MRRLTRRRFLKKAGWLAAGLGLSVLPGFRRARAATLTAVKFGYIPLTTFAPVFLADKLGYLSEAGIKMEYQIVVSGAEATAYLAAGRLDIAGGGVGASTFNALARGLEIRAVTDKGIHIPGLPPSSQLIVRKDLYDQGVRSVKDLKGLKLAINLKGSSSHYEIVKALEKDGLKESDINLLAMPFPEMVVALGNKAIDACDEVEPFVTEASERGYAVPVMAMPDVVPYGQYAVNLYGQPFIQQKQEVAFAFAEAWIKGTRKYYELGPYHPSVVEVLEKMTNVKAPVLKKVAPPWFDINGDINAASLADEQEFHFKAGRVPKKVEMTHLVDKTFLEAAWKKLGKKENPGKEYWQRIKPA